MVSWLVSSINLENIKIAYERLVWGFWDREAGEKQRKNWRPFIRLFNNLKPFDYIVFQIAGTGEIHGLGIIKSTYYDDQTLIWPKEIQQNKVLYPWRIELSLMIFSEEPFQTKFISISNYIDGYGIGEFPQHELNSLLSNIKSKIQLNLR